MIRQRPLLFLALSMSIAATGCSAGKEDISASAATQKAVVQTATLQAVPLHTAYNLSGTLQAYEERSLSFENGGRVANAEAVVGTSVPKGMVVARLDDADYRLQLQQAGASIQEAQAARDNAQANIQSAASSVRSAEAGIQSAQANVSKVHKGARAQEKTQAQAVVDKAQSAASKAKADAQRIQKLFQAGAVSSSDNEHAQLAAVSAEKDLSQARDSLSLLLEGATAEDSQSANASLQEAQASRSSALAAQEQAHASIQQAQAIYEKALIAKGQAELAMARSALVSPFNGVILEKTANTGELVGSGQAIYRIGTINKLKVLLPVPDSEITGWKKGQQVKIVLYDQTRSGLVSNIYPSTNTNTGTINVEVTIENPKQDWMPGQVIKAARQTSEKKGILVPTEAVIQTGDKPFVYKDVQGKAVKTNIELGDQMYENKLEIISGLREGDQIVIKGADSLFNGDAIQTPGGGRS